MTPIESTLYQSLQQTLNNHNDITLTVAYSGGVDSQVLLYALAKLKQNKRISNPIIVCHVNHGLSSNALNWQAFAQQECDKLSLKLIVKSVNVQAKAQQSLEELARDARYLALKSLTNKKTLILTGHHSDDQAETFLFALKRGAGLKGLSAMAVQTQLAQHLLVRPLLNISRQEIIDYAIANQLDWIEDESNLDTRFDRNFIRQTIMPQLRERWPAISKTVNRSASHCLAAQTLLDELAEEELSLCQASNTSLYIKPLKSLSPARFNNVIRFFLAQKNYLMPSAEQLKQLSNQLQANEDKNPEIKIAQYVFRRYKTELFITPDYQDISTWEKEVELPHDLAVVELPDGLGELIFDKSLTQVETLPCILLPEKDQKLTIRFSHDNPKCLPDFRQHSRSLKKVLQELNIAPWQRKRIAFLYYDEVLVSAVGHFICKPFLASVGQPSMQIKLKG
jgi:tRNA(Ile)-lysidine synthase